MNDFLACGSHFLVRVNDFLACWNHFLVCVNDFLSCGCVFLVCVDGLPECNNDFIVCEDHFCYRGTWKVEMMPMRSIPTNSFIGPNLLLFLKVFFLPATGIRPLATIAVAGYQLPVAS